MSSSPTSVIDDSGGGGGGEDAPLTAKGREDAETSPRPVAAASPPVVVEELPESVLSGGSSSSSDSVVVAAADGGSGTDVVVDEDAGSGPAVRPGGEEQPTKKTRLVPRTPSSEKAREEEAALPDPTTEGGRARKGKGREIINCLAGAVSRPEESEAAATAAHHHGRGSSHVDLWRLRSLALSPGGLLTPSIRRRAWPTLLSVHALIMETANIGSEDLLNGDLEGIVEVLSPSECDLAELRGDVMRRGGSSWHVERHIRRNRELLAAAASGPAAAARGKRIGLRPRSKVANGTNHATNETNRAANANGGVRSAPQAATLSPRLRPPPSSAPRKRVQIVPPPPSPCGASYAGEDGSTSPPTPLVQYHSSNGTNGGAAKPSSPAGGRKKVQSSALLPPSIPRGSSVRVRGRSAEEREVLLSVVTSALRSPPPTPSAKKASAALSSAAGARRERLRYYTGLHDLAALLLIQLESPSLTSLALRRLSENHLRDAMRRDSETDSDSTAPATSADGGGGSLRPLDAAVRIALPPLLREVDSELHDFFFDPKHTKKSSSSSSPASEGGDEGCSRIGRKRAKWIIALAARWMSTWFVRDVHDADVAGRLVDALLVGHPLMPLYFIVALLTHPANRERILACCHPDEGDESSHHSIGKCDGSGLKALLERLPREALLPKDETEGDGGDEGSFGKRGAESHDDYLDLLEWRKSRDDVSLLRDEREEGGDHTLTREDELSRLLGPADSLVSRAVALLSSVPPPTLLRLARVYHHDHRRRRNHIGGDDRRSLLPYLHAMDEASEPKSKARAATAEPSDGRHALAALRCPLVDEGSCISWAVSSACMTDWEALARMASLRREGDSSPKNRPSVRSVAFSTPDPAATRRHPPPSYRAAMDAAGFDPEGGFSAAGRRRRKIALCASALVVAGGTAASAAVAYKVSGDEGLASSLRDAGQGAMKLLVNMNALENLSESPTLRGEEEEEVPTMVQSYTGNGVDDMTLSPPAEAEEAVFPSLDAEEDGSDDFTVGDNKSDGKSSPHTTLPPDLSSSSSTVDPHEPRKQRLSIRAAAGEVARGALVGAGPSAQQRQENEKANGDDARVLAATMCTGELADDLRVTISPAAAEDVAPDERGAEHDAEASKASEGVAGKALEGNVGDVHPASQVPSSVEESTDHQDWFDEFPLRDAEVYSLDGSVRSFESVASQYQGDDIISNEESALFGKDDIFTSSVSEPNSFVGLSNESESPNGEGTAHSSVLDHNDDEDSGEDRSTEEAEDNIVTPARGMVQGGVPEEAEESKERSTPFAEGTEDDIRPVGPGDSSGGQCLRTASGGEGGSKSDTSSSSVRSEFQRAVKPRLSKLHRMAFAGRTDRYSPLQEDTSTVERNASQLSVDNTGGIHLLSESVRQWNNRREERSKKAEGQRRSNRKGLGRIRRAVRGTLKGATFSAHYY